MSFQIYSFIVWASSLFTSVAAEYPSVSINYWREDFEVIKHQLATGDLTLASAKSELISNINYKKMLLAA